MDKPQYAGFWRRVYADCIDSIILDAICIAIGLIALGIAYTIKRAIEPASLTPSLMDAIDPFWLQILFFGSRISLSFIYYVWGTFKYQTSIGKRLFKIYVVSVQEVQSETADGSSLNYQFNPPSLGQSVIRCCAYVISYLTLCAGFLMAGLNREKRALHDLIAGTACVVRRGEPVVRND